MSIVPFEKVPDIKKFNQSIFDRRYDFSGLEAAINGYHSEDPNVIALSIVHQYYPVYVLNHCFIYNGNIYCIHKINDQELNNWKYAISRVHYIPPFSQPDCQAIQDPPMDLGAPIIRFNNVYWMIVFLKLKIFTNPDNPIPLRQVIEDYVAKKEPDYNFKYF